MENLLRCHPWPGSEVPQQTHLLQGLLQDAVRPEPTSMGPIMLPLVNTMATSSSQSAGASTSQRCFALEARSKVYSMSV